MKNIVFCFLWHLFLFLHASLLLILLMSLRDFLYLIIALVPFDFIHSLQKRFNLYLKYFVFSIFYECFVIYCFISDVLLFCKDSQRYQSIKVVFCAVMRVLEMLLLFIFTHCCQEHTCHVSYHFNLLIVFAHRCFCNCLSLQCQFLVIPILPIYPFTWFWKDSFYFLLLLILSIIIIIIYNNVINIIRFFKIWKL